jgi:hypothetical protein
MNIKWLGGLARRKWGQCGRLNKFFGEKFMKRSCAAQRDGKLKNTTNPIDATNLINPTSPTNSTKPTNIIFPAL